MRRDAPDAAFVTAQVQLAAGIPFPSDKALRADLTKAGVPPPTIDAIVDDYADARLDGLRAALSVLAVAALLAVAFSGHIPTVQPSEQLTTRRDTAASTTGSAS